MVTHYVELGAPHTRILYTRCGQTVHAREEKRVHSVEPTCETCRALLAEDWAEVEEVTAMLAARAAAPSPSTHSSATSDEAKPAGPFSCVYCSGPCELSDYEPYCSSECAALAMREDEADHV